MRARSAALTRITPFPSGRAARVKVSGAFHLPPNCYCDRQGNGCHPSGAHPPGTRPERRLHANSNRKPYIASTPAARIRRKSKLPRRYRKSNFPQYVDKFVCGRGHPRTSPGGGDPQEGARPPLARPRRAGAPSPPPAGGEILPVRHGHFPSAFLRRNPPGESQRRTP